MVPWGGGGVCRLLFDVHQMMSPWPWSLYSRSPLSSRPQRLGSGGDATPCEDTREDFGLPLELLSTAYFCRVVFLICVVAWCATSLAGRQHARSSRESRDSCFQLPDLLGKVHGQRVTPCGRAGPRVSGARASGIVEISGASHWCTRQRHCGNAGTKGSTHKRATPAGRPTQETAGTNPKNWTGAVNCFSSLTGPSRPSVSGPSRCQRPPAWNAVRHPQVRPRAVFLWASSCAVSCYLPWLLFSCSLPALRHSHSAARSPCVPCCGNLLWAVRGWRPVQVVWTETHKNSRRAQRMFLQPGLVLAVLYVLAGLQRRYERCALCFASPVVLRQFDFLWPCPSLCLSSSALHLWVLRPFPPDCRALCQCAPSKAPAACGQSAYPQQVPHVLYTLTRGVAEDVRIEWLPQNISAPLSSSGVWLYSVFMGGSILPKRLRRAVL